MMEIRNVKIPSRTDGQNSQMAYPYHHWQSNSMIAPPPSVRQESFLINDKLFFDETESFVIKETAAAQSLLRFSGLDSASCAAHFWGRTAAIFGDWLRSRDNQRFVKARCTMDIDLHGYHPSDIIDTGILARIVEQAWDMGEQHITFIHGHGKNKGISVGFVNTNTGYFGLQIRSELRSSDELRQWIKYTTLDCSDPGVTSVKLKNNPSPIRTALDSDLLPERPYRY
jgi:hypothetical protein